MDKKWQLCDGSKLDWSGSRYWWVMTTFVSGQKLYPKGPTLVYNFDSMGLAVISVPREAQRFFSDSSDKPKEIKDNSPWIYTIPDSAIWARMPATSPPDAPNVELPERFKDADPV